MSISRRDLLALCAGAPALLDMAQVGRAGHSLTLQPRAIVIDGKPAFLASGTIDYFRCPHELWRDLLLKAKRGGLNAIAFCVAWNFNEQEEGEVDFTGDRNLGLFLDLCGELGLYAFPRVGPFICDEWEAGGYPAWLLAKPGVELRINNPVAMPYVRRWFEKLIPVIAKRQVTRGGPAVLVQQENEYFFVGRPGVREYQDFLIGLLKEFGIEVPITDCSGSNPEIRRPESLRTLNGGGEGGVRQLQAEQPGRPAFVSELYTDFMNMWGWPISSYPSAEMVYQQTMETLAAGGMYNYFMYYGGTNFGFWASTTWKSDQSFITTRYYGRAPLAEGGAFNETYYATKAVNLLARNFEEYLTAGAPARLPVGFGGPVRGEAVATPQGHLLFVHPRFPVRLESVYHTDGQGPLIQLSEDWPTSEIASQAGTLELPSGERIELAEPSAYPSMLPFGLEIGPDCRIDFANATLLGVAGEARRRVLLFRGEAGRRGLLSVNRVRAQFVFPPGAPARLSVGGVTVLGLSREAADRTWFAEGRVLIGPAFVGSARDSLHECHLDGRCTSIQSVSAQGEITVRDVEPAPPATLQMPIRGWVARPLPEIQAHQTGWRELDQPRGVEELGAYYGYTWYRAACQSAEKRATGLLFTAAADRVHVFVNGRRMGVWGRGPGAVRDPLPVELSAGENQFVFLCDNMGQLSEGSCNDRKGILGPAYLDARTESLGAPAWSRPEAPPTNSWRYQTYRASAGKGTLFRGSYEIMPRAGDLLILALRWVPQYAWVSLDGKLVGEHSGDLSLADGNDFSTFVLEPQALERPNRLEITFWGPDDRKFDDRLRLLSCPKDRMLERWGFRPWRDPDSTGPSVEGNPTWWECEFDKSAMPGPFFLVPRGLSKGQAWLNARPVGRYWEIGPQHSLYLPAPWLQTNNRLALFDEEGNRPDGAYLIRDSRVPVEQVLA